jgi:SulP family sulfate permease
MRSLLPGWGDFLGAFGDLPVLLPLVILLAQVPGYSLPLLLGSAGVASLASFWIFRVPVSIQPLKSIAIAAVALGAGSEEIRVSGMLLGAFFLVLAACRKTPLPIPEPVIRSVQTALGVLLVIQGFRNVVLGPVELTLMILAVAAFFFLDRKSGLPLLGIGSLMAFIEACVRAREPSTASINIQDGIRGSILAGLILPQLALTSANSIAGARLALQTYFPEQTKETGSRLERRLMSSIGVGNLLSGLFHGLPFCHGAGGITAHVRSGAKGPIMNGVLGILLGFLAWLSARTGFVPVLEPRIGCLLLTMIGLHHLNFATPLISKGKSGWILLAGSVSLIVLTGNLLHVLVFALIFTLIENSRKLENAHE